MPKTARRPPTWTAPTLVVLIAIGCSSSDDRLVDLSQKSADRQADQNRLVEANNRQVLEATKRLVEADARGRTENLELHRQIEVERSGVNQQRDALEHERRQIAARRNRDPIIAESIQLAAGLIAAVLPLLVCLFLLRGLFDKPDQDALAELLIDDLVSRQPLLDHPASLNLPETGGNPRLPVESPPEAPSIF
jgi:hypothetical protein